MKRDVDQDGALRANHWPPGDSGDPGPAARRLLLRWCAQKFSVGDGCQHVLSKLDRCRNGWRVAVSHQKKSEKSRQTEPSCDDMSQRNLDPEMLKGSQGGGNLRV